jgi:hypothetical protein
VREGERTSQKLTGVVELPSNEPLQGSDGVLEVGGLSSLGRLSNVSLTSSERDEGAEEGKATRRGERGGRGSSTKLNTSAQTLRLTGWLGWRPRWPEESAQSDRKGNQLKQERIKGGKTVNER